MASAKRKSPLSDEEGPRFGGPEGLVFLGAVLVITTLLVWWAVFASRLILEREDMATQLAQVTIVDPVERQAHIAALDAQVQRQMMMIIGEGTLFGVMLLVCTGTLFVVARRRRMASQRLVRLLQFTTHELKTPIAGVRALLQSLQLGSIPEQQRARFLESGLLECNRLEHLAETILAFQRAASQARLHPVRAHSQGLITDVLEHRKRTFGADEVQRAGAQDSEIYVDKDAFRVVLENLLDNARKYGGGKVVMTESVQAGRWRLELKDEGVGFDPSEGERLFRPFERDTKEGVSTHGSGLGLYISRQLMRGMGGDLAARSDGKARGAVFIIELPTVTGAPEAAHA